MPLYLYGFISVVILLHHSASCVLHHASHALSHALPSQTNASTNFKESSKLQDYLSRTKTLGNKAIPSVGQKPYDG